MTSGERIKKFRKESGLTQAQLARLLKMTPQNISQYERGLREAKPETLKKIGEKLGVSWLQLAGDIDQAAELLSAEYPESLIGIDDSGLPTVWPMVGRNNLSDSRRKFLLVAFDQLNDSGQNEAIKRVEELTELPKYRREDNAECKNTAENLSNCHELPPKEST